MLLIRAIDFANGMPCPHAGQYLQGFNHHTKDGLGYGDFTADKARAMRFATHGEAIAFYRTVSKTKPVRQDGKPNRPMTCLTIALEHDT